MGLNVDTVVIPDTVSLPVISPEFVKLTDSLMELQLFVNVS